MFVVYDLETTGLSSLFCDVIQFSYCLFDHNNNFVRSECLYFYHNGMHWDESLVEKVHHIPLDYLKTHEDKFKENLIKMFTVLHLNNVAGHNIKGFDAPFAVNWLARMGLPGLQFASVLDTMEVFRPMTKRARVKLTKLADMNGITPEIINAFEKRWFANCDTTQAHNANYDTVETSLLLLSALRKGWCTFDPQVANEYEASFDSVTSIDISEDFDEVVDPVCTDYFYVKTDTGSYKVSGGVATPCNHAYNASECLNVTLTKLGDAYVYENEDKSACIRMQDDIVTLYNGNTFTINNLKLKVSAINDIISKVFGGV